MKNLSERRPVLFGALIVLFMTVISGGFIILTRIYIGPEFNAERIIFLIAYAFQVYMCFQIERPIHVMLPFIASLIGFAISEIVYFVALGLVPPGEVPVWSYMFSSAVVTLFGIYAAASIGGLITQVFLNFFIKLIKAAFHKY